jgi:uncharacterized protein (TIGR03118 family)
MNRPLIRFLLASTALITLTASPLCWAKGSNHKHGYARTNLVSDTSAFNPVTIDPNLVNSWGLDFLDGFPFWVADNGKGVATLYDGQGNKVPLTVTIPAPNGGTSAPTGLVANKTVGQFKTPKGDPNGTPAVFLFATEDGTIAAWKPSDGAVAELPVDNSAGGAVYKGLAIGANAGGAFLYATNFHAGTVDVFDTNFAPATLSGNFSDPNLPAGYAPFGIARINGNLFVTFALQKPPDNHDDLAGPGHGFVDIFDTNGNLIQRFASRGKLNSPWGIAVAPYDFGRSSTDILIGNFGDGRINAFKSDGQFNGQLKDPSNQTIVIDGLWALEFGGAAASDPNTLFFTSGPNGESDGLFGSLTPQ